jgi:hypothetical protein
MEKQVVKFLDYKIINTGNSDGWVLQKEKYTYDNLWESHLGNFSDVESAKEYAVYYFMIARPAVFSAQIMFRMKGTHAYHDGALFIKQLEKENIPVPAEVGISNDMNRILTFKGRKI